MALILRSIARSDVGLVREGNEDSGYAGPQLLAVADGMGGHAAGEVASSATIDELLQVENGTVGDDATNILSAAIVAANDRIRDLVIDDPRREGMGTTLTALMWTGEDIAVAHIGDSRAYLLRDGQLSQITHDHTFVQSLIDEGRISVDEADVHPARSLILKALDGKPDPEPDLEILDAQPGDRFLVCSDGLSGVVSDDTLRDTLAENHDLTEAADALVELALRGGAPDNVTVVIGDVVETDSPPGPDDTAQVFVVGAASGEDQPPPAPRRRSGLRTRGRAAASEPEPDPEEIRYAPQPPRRYRWLRRIVVVAIAAAVLWAGASLASDWIRGQYYVGDQAGEVAVFRGVSQEVGPLRLSELDHLPGGLPVDALPEVFRTRVESTIAADSLGEAQAIVQDLRRQACAAHPPRVVFSPDPPPSVEDDGEDPPEDDAPLEPSTTIEPGYPGLQCPEAS